MQDKGNRRSSLRAIINKSSIYNTLLLWGRVSPEHVKLNSTKQQPQSLDYDREYSPQRIEFTHTPPGTTINIKRSFQMLEDIGKQDLFRWKDEFLQTVKLAQWDEQTALQVLRSAIDAKYFYLLEGTTTLSDSFSAIFKFKYPEKNYLKYLNQLSNLKQDNFLTIKEYKDKIEELCIRISICMNWNEQQKTLKVDETFFHGLSRRTQLEMARLNVRSISEMYAIINTTEETLLEQLEGASGFSHHKESKDKKQDKQRKTLRCRYHGECRHSTEDCDYLNNKKTKQQLEKQSSDHGKNNYSIENGNHQLKSLNIVSYIRGKPFRCILDTGSTFSYIGKEIVRELNLAERKSEIIEANLINGQKIRTDKMTTQNLILENNQTHIYKADLNIIDSQEKVLILGIDFLIKNNVKIDFDEGVITVNNINLEIPNYNKKSSVESILEEKNTIFTSSTSIISPKVLSLVEENTGIENLGKIKEGEHEIKLEREEVINKPPYRIPLTAKERVIEEIQKLLNNGIIRKSMSNYSSPSFPILKKNGNIRLVIDYRSLNKITQPDHYIFPKICDIFSKLHGMKVFSKIDLKSGYYQVPMKDSSIKYTAFSVENDRFEWLRMPFGLVNAPKTFQRIMDKLFAGHENVVVYIDDVLVYSKNAEDHQDHLTRVLKLLNSNGVKMNLDKTEFFKEEIEFLGHKISGNGILPVTDKLEKITKIKPNKKKDIQHILGLLNYFRQFIRNFSTKTIFLTDKLKKQSKFIWNEKDQNQLELISHEIISSKPLKFPDPNKEFILFTDASDRATGAILKQEEDTIGLYSHKFTSSERNYTVVEKETLGVLLALQYFRSFLLTNHVIVYTDNQNLIYEKDLSKRIQRWKLLLEEFSYEFRKIEGQKNSIADAISRLNFVQNTQVPNMRDMIINKIKEVLKNPKESNVLEDQAQVSPLRSFEVIKLPPESQEEIISYLHVTLAHPGSHKLYKTIRNHIKGRNLKERIEKVVNRCKPCQINKLKKSPEPNNLGSLHAERAYQFISSDILGPIKSKHFITPSDKEYFYILSITDIYSRFTRLFYLSGIKSSDILPCFSRWIEETQKPEKLLTDNGRQYTSNEFKMKMDEYEIVHVFTSPHNPRSNGISERINATVKNLLRIYKNADIFQVLCQAEINLNLTYNRNLKASPIEIIYGESVLGMLQENKITDKEKRLSIELAKHSNNQQNKIPKKRFKKGDKVLIKNFHPDKILDAFSGPYKISKINYEKGYVLVDKGNSISRQNLRNVFPYVEGGECGATTTNISRKYQEGYRNFLETLKDKRNKNEVPICKTKETEDQASEA